MTNKEAIEYLKEAQSHIDLEMGGNTQKVYDAIDLAIEALEERPTGEWKKVTEAHEDIGYDRGFRDGYARCITEHVLIQKEFADCGFVASAVLKDEKENT